MEALNLILDIFVLEPLLFGKRNERRNKYIYSKDIYSFVFKQILKIIN